MSKTYIWLELLSLREMVKFTRIAFNFQKRSPNGSGGNLDEDKILKLINKTVNQNTL